jgi:hypothetical protein
MGDSPEQLSCAACCSTAEFLLVILSSGAVIFFTPSGRNFYSIFRATTYFIIDGDSPERIYQTDITVFRRARAWYR